MPNELLDINIFDDAKAMMQHKFSRIIGYFFEDTQTYLDSIEKGITQKDASLIIPAAHTIKSSSRQLGAVQLSALAAALEEGAKEYLKNQQDFAGLHHLADQVKQTFPATQRFMEERI